MISIRWLQFFPWNWPKIDREAVKNADKICSRVSKVEMLCFFKTKHCKTGIYFEQVSTIQTYISQVHCAWIMCMNFSIKTEDGILVFVKYLKIFPKLMSLSVPHPPCLDETKKIWNSSCSGIADLVFSSALSTPKTTRKFKI